MVTSKKATNSSNMSRTIFATSLLLVLLAAQVFAAVGHQQTPKLVRVKLEKKTAWQSGELGQPVTSYFANVVVGTPAKPFKMLLDINAREIWLPHYLKLGIIFSRLNYRDGYSKKDSSTSVKEQSEVYKIDYKGCELSGKAYKDLFEIKNISESLQLVRYEQRFLAISSASNDKFTRFEGMDGVLALNPWPISETGSDMTSVSLQRAGITNKLRFALALEPDLNTGAGGELAIGGLNPTKFIGDIRYHQVVSQHSWELGLQSVMLGAGLVGSCHGAGRGARDGSAACKVYLSTTSNDIYGPTRDIQSIHKLLGVVENSQGPGQFEANSLREIDCLKVATLPMLTFVIDGAYYVLPPTSYIRKKVDGLIFKSETCYVALLANGSANKWELGTNFLANYYTVFDQETRLVGFGVRK